METNKTPRLLAAAKEFNIGKALLIEFLTNEGFEVNASNPNTKLTEAMYDALSKQFGRDKQQMSRPKGVNILGKINLDDLSSRPVKKPELTLEVELAKLLSSSGANGESLKARIQLLQRLVSYKEAPSSQILDLSNLGLDTIPREALKFTGAKKINLSGNLIRRVDDLTVFLELEEIDLSDNLLVNLPSLSELNSLKTIKARNNSIDDIRSLPPSIQTLDLAQNKIDGFVYLNDTPNLISLDISFNESMQDISVVFTCVKLKALICKGNVVDSVYGIESLFDLGHLDLSHNQLNDISPVFDLPALRVLNLSNNIIERIDGIERLSTLSRLNISGNRIYDLSSLESLLRSNQDLFINISANQLSDIKLSPDLEENHFDLIWEYFQRQNSDRKEEEAPVNFIQLLVLGNGETGKTSLLNVLRDTYMDKEKTTDLRYKLENIYKLPEDSTHGNIHYYWDLRFKDRIKDKYIVLVKDFGGQEYYHNFHPVFYHPKAIYWIVNALNTSGDVRVDNGYFKPNYWYNNVSHYLQHHHASIEEEHSKRIWLLNTKIDIAENRNYWHYSTRFAKIFNICSLNIKEFGLLDFLERQAFQSARLQLYYELRQEIEKSSGEMILKISLQVFENLRKKGDDKSFKQFIFSKIAFKEFLISNIKADQDIIESNFETIINDLRYLGLCLYFPANRDLKDYIYLFPQKIAEAVFNGILSKSNLEGQRGILRPEILEKQIEVQRLLEHFEIIFRDGNSLNWIVPQYLPNESEQEELISLATDGLDKELIIEFPDFMPQGIVSRLICYFGRNPYSKWYWRNGIFFTHNLGNHQNDISRKALVRASWENGFTISIKANDNVELEKIFVKLLLSYYNQPLNLDGEFEEIKEGINPSLDEVHTSTFELTKHQEERRDIYLSWLNNIKASPLKLSLSLNGETRISLQKFKSTISSLVNHDYISDDYSFNPYIKIRQYLPFLQYLIDTKDFQSMFNPKKIFISYSHRDSDVRAALDAHLKLMVRTGVVSTWHDMRIDIGTKWDEKIEAELRSSDVVILLLSSDFFASDYIWNKELPIIMEKLESGSGIVIPILCRHCISNVNEIFDRTGQTKEFRFDVTSLQGLPIKNEKLVPIHSEAFKFIDEAYEQISKKLVQLISKAV